MVWTWTVALVAIPHCGHAAETPTGVTLTSPVPRSPTTSRNEPSGVRPGGRGPEYETPSVGVSGTVAFVSLATNLVTGQRDTNGTVDVFLFQRS